MTNRLLLMRHAKSDWKDGLSDKERPLNSRGKATAPMMANWVFEHDCLPNLVVCSGAIRTQQTLELMMHQWTTIRKTNPSLVLPQMSIDDSLYLASHAHILSIAQSRTTENESRACIMMLGHNSGMEVLASKLSGCHVVMPTGAIAILVPSSTDGEWPDDWQDAKMWNWRGLVKPRELGTETI